VAFCPTCGMQIADGASCPKCAGGAVGGAVAAAPTDAGLTDNVAGALAYLFIPAIIFLVLEPYNRKRFVRFHSFQSLFVVVVWVAFWIVFGIFTHIPFLGWAAAFILGPLIGLAFFVLWLILTLKAYQGQMFKLPVIGDMAEQQAGK
jgi:uncharacterized membrane protein